jgi:hypothetical protein
MASNLLAFGGISSVLLVFGGRVMVRRTAFRRDFLPHPAHAEGCMPEAIDFGPIDIVYLGQLLEFASELKSDQPEFSEMPGSCDA